MFPTVRRWGIPSVFAAGLALLLPAEPAQAQGRLQSTQNGGCQRTTGQGQQTSLQRLSSLQSALQSTLQQLNTLQQNSQLTSDQLQAVSQLQSALQDALQQVLAFQQQNGNLTAAPLQSAGTLSLRPVPLRGRR